MKIDLNIEYQRLAAWLATQSMSLPVGNAERGSDITVYFVRSSPANDARNESWARRLGSENREIGATEPRNACRRGPRGGEIRIRTLKERRAEIAREFTASRWDALMAI